MEDAKIVQLYLDRNEAAITESKIKYDKYLMKISYNILFNNEDAEESVNDTYLSAWNSIPPHKPEVLSTFLGKIARGHAIDIYRRHHAEKRIPSEYCSSLDELEECVPGTSTVEDNLEAKRLGEVINEFLKTQKEDARNLFIGRYFYSDSLKEVAEYNGMTEAKAKMILFRTRQKLKEYLEKEGFNV
ncbi:MAG: sigma-70 family RNA polymerase sigma factor [Lachnospiraceae bacterium]|nr:sigma-70 family RNA polymerase sigma factor [Lachnospiraceae bacterium]